jgi:hypothetical protein
LEQSDATSCREPRTIKDILLKSLGFQLEKDHK